MLIILQGDDLTAYQTRDIPSLVAGYEMEKPQAIEAEEKELEAFSTLRQARADKRHEGQRKKRADAKQAEETAKK